ncbi:MAG: hypothetical protein ACI957_001546 [Verrucomicrobiales bacterium]|jgi:hypothetical protein
MSPAPIIAQEVNPFASQFVAQPREIGDSVKSYHQKALEHLLAKVERARTSSRQPATLVASIEPGCGKSHLLGRLFTELHDLATPIYVHPFGDETSAWTSLLHQTVQEMTTPLSAGGDAFDTLANGILGHIAAEYISQDPRFPPSSDFIQRLQTDPSGTMGLKLPFSDARHFFEKRFDSIASNASRYLKKSNIALPNNHSVRAWLMILLHYATAQPGSEIRERCLDWIMIRSRPEDASELGISPVDCEPATLTASQSEERCRLRLRELCAFAGFYRPFVFCFDQTEAYGSRPPLARELGRVVAELANSCLNQITILTSNIDVWKQRLEPHMERADLDRISDTIELELLRKLQGTELAKLRLKAIGKSTTFQDDFVNTPPPIREAFDTGPMSPRRFLKLCEKQFGTHSEPSLEALFQVERERLLGDAKSLRYNAEILKWFVSDLPPESVSAEKLQDPHFERMWTHPNSGRQVFFAFESGFHWARWLTTAERAERLCQDDPAAKGVALRTDELPQIPPDLPRWPEVGHLIRRIEKLWLEVRVLTKGETADIYASWSLYTQAMQRDITNSEAEVLTFLQKRSALLWKDLQKPLTRPSLTPVQLAAKIEPIIRKNRLIGFKSLQDALGFPVTRQMIDEACAHISNVEVTRHPIDSVYQWKS